MYSNLPHIRVLTSLLKKYGIQHIVVSSGARNIQLARTLNAEGSFTTYSVVDERSAAFFALGVSQELGRPVAMCCTSGTSCANYVSAVAEAYYRNIPLVVITGDIPSMWLGQGERQMIPQQNLLKQVTRKSVSIRDVRDYRSNIDLYEAERLMSEALLELDHHGGGPVHINLEIGSDFLSFDAEELETVKRVRRTTLLDSETKWAELAERLKAAKNIMVVYGQNSPVSDEEKQCIERFARQYDCAIAVDHLANLSCDGCVPVHNMFLALTPPQINALAAPDIIVTLNGRCHSRLTHFRFTAHKSEHWHVTPSGAMEDRFMLITDILECSPAWFFRFFSQHGGEPIADRAYFRRLSSLAEQIRIPDIPFSNIYAVREAMKRLPKNSMLHIGVGRTPELVHMFPLDGSIAAYCNQAAYGIDGCCSTFIGQAWVSDRPAFLIIGDLSFFYDMNSIWNRQVGNNVRILLLNNGGTSLIPQNGDTFDHIHIGGAHAVSAKGWVESVGFKYLSADNEKDFLGRLPEFTSTESDRPVLFEVFTKKDGDKKVWQSLEQGMQEALPRAAIEAANGPWRSPFPAKLENKPFDAMLERYILFRDWMELRGRGGTLADLLKVSGYSTIAIYGYGELGRFFMRELPADGGVRVKCIIDRNPGLTYPGIPVIRPETDPGLLDAIVVCVYDSAPVEKMLRKTAACPVVSLAELFENDRPRRDGGE